jgi:hypothetical protein
MQPTRGQMTASLCCCEQAQSNVPTLLDAVTQKTAYSTVQTAPAASAAAAAAPSSSSSRVRLQLQQRKQPAWCVRGAGLSVTT